VRARHALVVAALGALLLAGQAAAATTPTGPGPVYDSHGRLIETPYAPASGPRLSKERATAIFERVPRIAGWLRRYPHKSLTTDAKYEPKYLDWKVDIWSNVPCGASPPAGCKSAGEIATGYVADESGVVTDAWTGPQVAWSMARGGSGSFGGREINSIPVWLLFCGAFLIGLGDLRRPLSLRNLDLVALLSFTASLWFFNHGRIFWSVPLAYPPLVYLLVRMLWSGVRNRAPVTRPPVWPVWMLAAATVFFVGFRIGLNAHDSNVIDVGYSGVIGAQRIWSGETPYGHMPTENLGQKACAAADREGRTAYRIQTNGRCEAGDANGDTYGPVSYQAYLPGYWAFGWKGIGDKLNAARFTSVLFDVIALLGLALVGLRFGGRRLAVTLAFAWAAYPFTQYVSSSNTNDAIMPAFLIFGFWLASSPVGRGAFAAFSGWTKFASLVVAPLWATYPDVPGRLRPKVAFVCGFVLSTALSFWILLLEPDPIHAARVFFDRSLRWQIGRDSPFSLWDWRQYHAGLPDLHVVQLVLAVLVGIAAVAFAFVPRRKTPLQLAALTAALLIGFELVQTHWFYLYLPWFFPFVAFAVLAPTPEAVPEEVTERDERPAGELVPAG
jgi:hypothetical protein